MVPGNVEELLEAASAIGYEGWPCSKVHRHMQKCLQMYHDHSRGQWLGRMITSQAPKLGSAGIEGKGWQVICILVRP